MACPLGGTEAAGGEMQETIPGGLVIFGDCNLNHQGQLPGYDFSRAAQVLFQDFHGVSGRHCRSSSSPWTGEAGPCCTSSNGGATVGGGGAREPEQQLSTGPWVQTNLVFISVKTL